MADPVPTPVPTPTSTTITLSAAASTAYTAWLAAKAISDADDTLLGTSQKDLADRTANVIAAQQAVINQQSVVTDLTAKDADEHKATSTAATAFITQLMADLNIAVPSA